MPDVDRWLADAALVTKEGPPIDTGSIRRRIANEPVDSVIALRGDMLRVLACAGVAALIGFSAIDRLGDVSRTTGPTWVAAPSAASPYGLLVGDR